MRRDQRVVGEPALLGAARGAAIASSASPSTTLAALVDEDAAVGVAVERDADVGALLDDGALQRAGCSRAAVAVDVLAVGLDSRCAMTRRAELVEHLGRDPVRGAVARSRSTTRRPSSVSSRGKVFFTKTL